MGRNLVASVVGLFAAVASAAERTVGKAGALVVPVAAGALVASNGVMAQTGIDVSEITGALGEAGTAIGLIAAAMLLVAGAGIAIKWVLGFIFS